MPETYPILDTIAVHPLINKMVDDLTFNQFFHRKMGEPAIPIDENELRKAIWLASILATSDLDEHRTKTQLFASLLYLQYPADDYIGRAIYVLFSRLGNLTGARLLKHNLGIYTDLKTFTEIKIDAYDSALMLELELEKSDKSIISGDELITTTRFQQDLWNQLETHNRVIISAPTSSGKSFIIKKFLKQELSNAEQYTGVYIVPSRALLNQVSEDLRKEVDLDHVSIKTVYIQDELEEKKPEIFILTPERCLRLLKQRWLHDIHIDLIFIDEIQNVEDTQGRGALFEFVFKELFKLFPNTKIIAAGPNIDNPGNLFEHVFGDGSTTVETMVSPVFQIKTTVKPMSDNRLSITINSQENRLQTHTFTTEIDFLKRFNTSTGEGLKYLIQLCGKDEQNIIYSPKGNWAADWAIKFAETQESLSETDPWLLEIMEFLADEIHPLYQLIPCLAKQTAYHHGNLPDIVRKEIEDCFLEGKIRHLFCTSTLLQGVNLPANNLFIPMPKKRHLDLTSFDFGNLIGRAGRIKDSLYGTIFCIERKEDDEWSSELYSKSHKKTVQTAGEKSLERLSDFVNELSTDVNNITHETDRSAVVFFRQKYANDPDELREYLSRNSLSEEEIVSVEDLLKNSLDELAIPIDLLKLNPTIDPVLQNELFKQIQESGIESWLIPSRSENPNMYAYLTKEQKELLPFNRWNFYWQLDDLIHRLDAIFQLSGEAFFKHSISVTVRQICFYAREWLRNKNLRQMIDADINFYTTHTNLAKRIDAKNGPQVNDRINKVIKINSTVTTHILIKYMKLLNDLVEPFLNEELAEQYKFALALPTMLELGTTEPVVISLISRGVSRSIALKIFAEFKKMPGYEDSEIFAWLRSKDELKLKPIYNRYLKRMRLLKNT